MESFLIGFYQQQPPFFLGYYLSPPEGVVSPGVSWVIPSDSMLLIPGKDKIGT